jgi:gephyrin
MATNKTLKPVIIVISDTASQDPTTDKAGPVLSSVFAESSNTWEKPIVRIIPDNVLDIQRLICQYADGEEICNLIITSGGTGFAVKDTTPEVIN